MMYRVRNSNITITTLELFLPTNVTAEESFSDSFITQSGKCRNVKDIKPAGHKEESRPKETYVWSHIRFFLLVLLFFMCV